MNKVISLIIILGFFCLVQAGTPEVTSVEPDQGFVVQDNDLTLTGNGFEYGAKAALLTGGPVEVASLRLLGWSTDIELAGGFAYLSAGWRGLQIVDVSNPLAPVLAGSVDTPGGARRLALSGNFVYIADESGGMTIEPQWVPGSDSGTVILTGDDPEQLTALWEEITAAGGLMMPRIDRYSYGDVAMSVNRTSVKSPGGRRPSGSRISRELLMIESSRIRYRYDLSQEGVLTGARAWGPEVDLVFEVSAEDNHYCRHGVEIGFVEERRRVCEEFAAEHPELVIDCGR